MATKLNIYAQTMAHLHGGATTFAQPHSISQEGALHLYIIGYSL